MPSGNVYSFFLQSLKRQKRWNERLSQIPGEPRLRRLLFLRTTRMCAFKSKGIYATWRLRREQASLCWCFLLRLRDTHMWVHEQKDANSQGSGLLALVTYAHGVGWDSRWPGGAPSCLPRTFVATPLPERKAQPSPRKLNGRKLFLSDIERLLLHDTQFYCETTAISLYRRHSIRLTKVRNVSDGEKRATPSHGLSFSLSLDTTVDSRQIMKW